MIELALAFYLVFILPVRTLWHSTRKDNKPKRPLAQRYFSSMREIGLLLLALLLICWWNGYGAIDIGLALPSAGAPLWCLIAAAIAMAALLIGSGLSSHKMPPAKRAAALESGRESGMPTNAAEMRMFLVLVLFIGAGWELLYRGFLLLTLTPHIGTWGAVAVSGLAYGAAHGYKNPKQISLSIASALLFATGYVLSGSLWWLMVIHIALPLTGAISIYQLFQQEEARHALS
ncbi:CPBP family intramembrane glutamic endopeptidase [Duganella radicis]|uniref:CPBP family intramembrane metalloprotease n=1 Tax=Duganella radicis TaxID=551988 RepID=A0A6L6PDX4_9BURK|nr:CPBP family intramembrane glutamic endopeptidase [Duganella radicis]MTV36781.1 CPBP family intramembrane metalloprotease [Duganella radicis]